MNKQKYDSIIFNSFSELRFWKILGVTMLVCNVLLCIFAARVNLNVKTILVPLSFKKEFWIRGDQVSPAYVEEMASLFFDKLLNYNKSNALSQFDEILKHVEPDNYEAIKSKLYNDAQRIERNDVSCSFHLMSLQVKPMNSNFNSYVATAEGELVTIVGTQVISKVVKTYQIGFDYRKNQLFVNSYNELKKDTLR